MMWTLINPLKFFIFGVFTIWFKAIFNIPNPTQRNCYKKKHNLSKRAIYRVFILFHTFWRQQGQYRRGIEQFARKQVQPNQNVVEEDCTSRHCHWPVRNLAGRNLLLWLLWCQRRTTWGHCCIAFRNKNRSSSHCWTKLYWELQC